MGIKIDSPYSNDSLPWWRGNLHAHTTNSDGARDPQRVVESYAAHGYHFLMISDHDSLTDPESLDNHGLTLIPGNEITANGPHMLHVNARHVLPPSENRQLCIDAIAETGALAVVAHPNWQKRFAHCPQHSLEHWEGYNGIEIYNGVVRRLEGSPLATDRWDQLLGQGRRVWGFAHDDSHRDEDDAAAWIMVQSPANELELLLAGLQMGSFYASTGVGINSIAVDEQTIRVETANAQRIIAICDFGRRVTTVDAASIAFEVPDDGEYSYVRFECWGAGEAMAWTQPFFLGQ
ncbi:MAG: CehA/McbA family metallohydrolase [Candidatus Hydrogenedentes bacterium]|nr:CehA/McbA family metallohydrolase [Candidatus Hydrogenedentota bacterium]